MLFTVPQGASRSITNVVFPTARPQVTNIQTPQRICGWVLHIFTKFPHQIFRHRGIHVMPLSLYTLIHVAVVVDVAENHVNQRVVQNLEAPKAQQILRFMPTKQVEQAATVHNPRSCLGFQGVLLTLLGTNIWGCSFFSGGIWTISLEGIHDSWLLLAGWLSPSIKREALRWITWPMGILVDHHNRED